MTFISVIHQVTLIITISTRPFLGYSNNRRLVHSGLLPYINGPSQFVKWRGQLITA